MNFFDKTRYGGIPLSGMSDPAASFEFGGSVVLSEATALDVLVSVGLTGSAPDFRIIVARPIRY